MLSPRSATFHGRDVFGPAAAHLALGVAPAAFGPPLDPGALLRLDVPTATWQEDGLHTEVLYVDHFGNLRLSARAADLRTHGITPGESLAIRVGARTIVCPWRETFGAIEAGAAVLVEDSYWRLCLALNKANAAIAFDARAGTAVVLTGAESAATRAR
jgi:S-adenosylmethionine hydrolase